MHVWERIKGWVASNADQYVAAFLPDGEPGPDTALVPWRSYFRLWLSDMFLARDREWFTNRYPAVHASVSLAFSGGRATFTRVARPPEQMLGPGVRTGYPLSELMPYPGGVVEIEAGLLSIRGEPGLGLALDILGDFASLVAAPLGGALDIAGKITSGVEKLIAAGADVSLGYHQGFTAGGASGTSAGNVLGPGHIAVVLAGAADVPSADLSVVDGRLHRIGRPLTDYDYMVLRIEGRRERDDWRFPDLDRLIARAIEAQVMGKVDEYEALRSEALAKVVTSPDLTVPDRRRVAQAIQEELGDAESTGLGARGKDIPGLDAIMQRRAIPLQAAAALPPVTLQELLA